IIIYISIIYFRRIKKMKFVIKKQQLLKNIQSVVNAISSRTVIPILTGMKIDVRNNHVVLTGSNSDITIQAHIPQKIDEEEIITSMEEGTKLPPNQSDVTFNISIYHLKQLTKQTVSAVSTMETRPILTGVNVKLDNKKLEFTATDSHRLALRTINIEDTEIDSMNVVIP